MLKVERPFLDDCRHWLPATCHRAHPAAPPQGGPFHLCDPFWFPGPPQLHRQRLHRTPRAHRDQPQPMFRAHSPQPSMQPSPGPPGCSTTSLHSPGERQSRSQRPLLRMTPTPLASSLVASSRQVCISTLHCCRCQAAMRRRQPCLGFAP